MGTVRLAVSGTVSARTGAIRLRETRILNRAPNFWDLGGVSGQISRDGRLTGTGRDTHGRPYVWAFSR